jgi:hypothetical protein
MLFPALNIAQGPSETPHAVSFIELIANPAKFDGQLIFVTAFLGLDPPDGDALYLHKEDYDNGLDRNAVWIEHGKQIWADREKLDQNYVTVEGVFHAPGKNEPYRGSITNVRNCTLWSQPSNPIRQKLKMSHKPNPKPES